MKRKICKTSKVLKCCEYSCRRTATDKVLRDKAFNIAKNPKYDEYQGGVASMVYKIFLIKPLLIQTKE